MMHVIISLAGILITIFFVIGTHESAHFLMARAVGVKVLRFSIGFGKTLWRWQDKRGTEYVLSLIPLGGYVRMLDENEGDVAPEDRARAFNTQPYYKKFLIVLAGPLMNIACAFVLYWMIFMIGFTTVKPIIGNITPDSIAAQAGLKPQQEIVAADGHTISSWTSFMLRLITHAGDQDHFSVGIKTTAGIQNHSLDLMHWQLDGLTPDPLGSLGIAPYTPNIPLVIGYMAEGSPAMQSPLKMQDKLIAVNHTPIKTWDEVINFIVNHPDVSLTFTIERDGKSLTVPVMIGHQRNMLLQKSGYLGIGPNFTWPPELLRDVKYTPLAAFQPAWEQIYDFTYFNFLLVGKLITGKLSLQSLGGPITIFDSAGNALNVGLLAFLGFLAFLSISIGVINLLPIPGLDGGHLFLQTIEFIIRRPVPVRVLDVLYRFGFMLIIFVLLMSLINDFLRLH